MDTNDLNKAFGSVKGSTASPNQMSALDKVLNANSSFTSVKPMTDAQRAHQAEEERKKLEALEKKKAKLIADQKKAEEEAKRAEEERVLKIKEAIRKAEEEKAEAERLKRESLETNQILLSDVTGGVLPKSGIDHVITQYAEDHWEEEHRINIPEVDKFYKWDADVLEAMIMAYTLGERALLVGFPGTGKTSAVKQLAAWLRQPYARFNGKGGIEPASFLGYAWADWEKVIENGQDKVVQVMKYKEGLMPIAVRNNYMTTIDEVMKLSPDIMMALQSLLEKGGFLMLDDKPGTIADKHVHPGPEFKLYVTDNTLGTGDNMDLFASSQLQDTSSIDRLTLTIPVEYMEVEDEINMLLAKSPDCGKEDVGIIVRFAGLVRESYKTSDLPVTLSPRGLETVCGLLENEMPLETALKLVYMNKLASDQHKMLAREQLNTAR